MEKIKKYFQRIGLEMPEEIVPDSKLLKELQFAHCTSVPYENLDILRGIPLSLEIDDLYEKVVVRGKGGFSQGAALQGQEDAIGLHVTHLPGGIIGKPPGGVGLGGRGGT